MSNFVIGQAREFTPEDVRRTRTGGGGGGRKSELLTAVRALTPGQGLDLNVPADQDFESVAANISSKVYRKVSANTYAVGFKPRVIRNAANRVVRVCRVATPAAAATVPAETPVETPVPAAD